MHFSRKTIILIVTGLLLVIGLIAGLYEINQRQLFTKKASSDTGTVIVDFFPPSATGSQSLNVNDSLPLQVRLTPSLVGSSYTITGFTIKFSYTAPGALPFIDGGGITPDPALVSDGWTFPIRHIDVSGNTLSVSIGAIYTGGAYTLDKSLTVATVNFRAVAPGTANMTFDPVNSKLQDSTAGSGQDILLTPNVTGVYTVAGIVDTPTPTLTPIPTPTLPPGVTPSVTPIPTATLIPTVQPTAAPSAAPTPTVIPTSVPQAAAPNSCGGTCGTNVNCQAGLFCYQGFCRNPDCSTRTDCSCPATAANSAAATPTPSVLPKTAGGVPAATFLFAGIGLIVMGLIFLPLF